MKSASQVIYIHGFGGRDNAPQFHTALNAFFKAKRLRFDLSTYAWDSLPTDPQTLVRNFLQSQEEAEQAGRALHKRLLDLEAKQIDYHLVGFSLGAAVIRHMLNCQDTLLTHLRSIYLLGAAFNYDEPVNDAVISLHTRCHNYFSPLQDVVLNTAYYNATGIHAAGSKELIHMNRFQNFATHCSHALANNYTVLAQPIGFLIAWDDEQHLSGLTNINLELKTMEGKVHWNEICYYHDHLIQQNTYTKHFRALENNDQRRRKAWGSNLHAIFRAI
jgi:hypothetical protein